MHGLACSLAIPCVSGGFWTTLDRSKDVLCWVSSLQFLTHHPLQPLSIKQWVPLKVAFVTLPFKLTATLVALE